MWKWLTLALTAIAFLWPQRFERLARTPLRRALVGLLMGRTPAGRIALGRARTAAARRAPPSAQTRDQALR
jgi:hypothetical protein